MKFLHLFQVLVFNEIVYGKKVDITIKIFLIQLSIGQNLKVVMPDSYNPSFLPYWKRNIDTGEITGYFVDLLEELSRSVGFNYTLEDSSNFKSYESLGKMSKSC